MKISDLIDALKAFFLDFLGYFLPGIYALLVLTYVIQDSWKFNTDSISFVKGHEYLVILLFAYILGYIIYSLNLSDFIAKFKFLRIKTPIQIERDIEKGVEMIQCKKVLNEIWVDKNGLPVLTPDLLARMNVRNLRSIVMSYIPESDIKIYTFMFRSDLCKHISSFSLLCGISGCFFSIAYYFCNFFSLFNTGADYSFTYIILIVGSFFLMKTRSRFLSIAYKIPFSIFLAKYYKIT